LGTVISPVDYIFPDLRLSPINNRSYKTNDIVHRNIIVYGAQASGKTEFIRAYSEKLAEKYGAKQTLNIKSRFFPRLIKSVGVWPRAVNHFNWEDSTLKKQKDEELAAFYNVRNLYWSKTGINKGIIITSSNVHDLFGIKKQLRSSVDATFFRSLPTDRYDVGVAKDMLGENNFDTFNNIIKRRDAEPKLKSITYYNIRGETGFVDWDLAKNNHVIDLDPKQDVLTVSRPAPLWGRMFVNGLLIAVIIIAVAMTYVIITKVVPILW